MIEDALHVLEGEGLLAKSREGRVTKWAITDAGYEAMGQVPPVRGVHSGSVSWTAAVDSRMLCLPEGESIDYSRLADSQYSLHPPTADAAICSQVQAARARGGTVHTADEEAWAMAVARIKAARNRRRRLRRKGLTEWSCLSL